MGEKIGKPAPGVTRKITSNESAYSGIPRTRTIYIDAAGLIIFSEPTGKNGRKLTQQDLANGRKKLEEFWAQERKWRNPLI